MALSTGCSHEAVVVHEDEGMRYRENNNTEDDTEEMEESRGPLDESGGTMSDDEEEEDIDDSVLHDMDHDEEEEEEIDDSVLHDVDQSEQTFQNISQRYRLVHRIGEGTFSTVYKAEDLLYEHDRLGHGRRKGERQHQ
ncbi:unnamed protein product [Zymoseptoria tritici ST99CH_3D7]|uniref:Protein kinase domain-containing protein n=1 Tax=Zymoseptoria tritici (strain ST99CH_3D7) TaxID=1276538 RepID=A0A1X7SAF8_ZYMT9|nr:unnamed protein product [Zymoseptoria tritici ST99CH_3D7]